MPGDLIVVTGPPGAGKSSVSAVLRRDRVLVSGDDFFDLLGESMIKPWLPQAHRQNEIVIHAAAAAAGRFAAGGYEVVYDGMVGPWFLPAFLTASGLDAVHYVLLVPPLDVCLHRVDTRVGHGFRDADATRHMYDELAASPIAERHVLRDPPDSPDAAAGLITERWRAGELRWRP